MSAYQQMGHQSENLLAEPHLSSYRGAVLSPVNYSEPELVDISTRARFHAGYDVLFDPQLYLPRTQQKTLRGWSYLPVDFESADVADDTWWGTLVEKLIAATARVKPDGICSPVVLPREFAPEYFERSVATGAQLKTALEKSVSRAIQSAVVGLDYLAAPGRAMTTASILSRTACEEIYLVLVGDETPPRRELSDPEQLKGAMRLIAALERSDLRVIVAFSCGDMLLWKAAGATHCATGKFFNVRRFTRTRFEEPPAKGGGQLPYWFEESMMAFLRQSDIERVRPHGMLAATHASNPYSKEILDLMDSTPDAPWLALSWKQFLYWFIHAERRMAAGQIDVDALLESAEGCWMRLSETRPRVFMEEPSNNGAWVRQWRRAFAEFEHI
jgi:hypothetical protein